MHKCFSGERSKRINVRSESWVMGGEEPRINVLVEKGQSA